MPSLPSFRLFVPSARWRVDGARSRSVAAVAPLLLGLVLVGVVAGLLSVFFGDVSASRPAFIVALPLLIAMGFAFVVSPKSLVIAVIVLRGGMDPVFQNLGWGAAGGVGGMVNLAVIGLAFVLVLREPARVPRAAWWAWGPFLVMQFVGLVYSPDFYPSLRLVLAQVSTFAMFLLAFHLVDDFKSLDKALRLVVASSLPVVMLTIIAIARGATASSVEGIETVSGRYAGPFPHPNILAFYLVLIIGVVLYLWKRSRSTSGWGTKLGCAAYLLLLLALLYATKTRSAWLSAALLFFLYGIFFERRFLLYLVAAAALAMLIPEFRDRVLDLGQGNDVVQYARLNSFAWRKLIWTSGLSWMSPSHYLAGYGYNGFFIHSLTFFPMAGGRSSGAHSVPVQLFFDLGIVGLASFLWLFWASFKLMQPAYRLDSLLGILFGGVLVSYLLVSSSDNMLGYLVFNWYFWLTVGVVCAVAPTSRPPNAERTGAHMVQRVHRAMTHVER